jgi:hypothetical protein
MINEYNKRLRDIRIRDDIKQQKEHAQKTYDGENIFTIFKLWCLAFEHDMTDVAVFKCYLNVENITLTEHQNEYLMNKYFGGNK